MNNFQLGVKKQSGVVLVVGLIFMLAVTIVGVIAMQNTSISYQLSTNQAFSETAFQASETARSAIGESVANYIYDRQWSYLPSELTVLDKNLDGEPDSATADNGSLENLYDMDTLEKDMEYSWTASDGSHALTSSIYLVKTQKIIDDGAGAQQLSGYEGLGKAAAGGGGVIYFELRSRGLADTGARSITAAEYRAKIQ